LGLAFTKVRVRVNGYDTKGYQHPRWIPYHIAEESKFPHKEIISSLARGRTAEIKGDISSLDPRIPEHLRGATLDIVLSYSLERLK